MLLERRLEGRDQDLKLLQGQAGEVQELRGAGLHVSEPNTGHGSCLLSRHGSITDACIWLIGINSSDQRRRGNGSDHRFAPRGPPSVCSTTMVPCPRRRSPHRFSFYMVAKVSAITRDCRRTSAYRWMRGASLCSG